MRAKIIFATLAIAALACIRVASAQLQGAHSASAQHVSSMDGMDMSKDSDDQGASAATGMMSSHHMDMGLHMKMTELRAPQAGDQERAAEVVNEAKEVMQKYQDYHVALDDGFKIFLPNVPQHQYHFTNYRYGFEAHFRSNPEHPTSLLYDKTPDGYKLAGVMYTAPAKASEDELNQRIPLSVAQWHEHVNFCFPPKDKDKDGNPDSAKRIPDLEWADQSRPKKHAIRRAEASSHWSLAGWCTFIRMRKTYGRWGRACTITTSIGRAQECCVFDQ